MHEGAFPPSSRPCAHLELFKLPSSEAALEGPLFFDNHDLTPSTRSSSSESTSESPSLWMRSRKVGKAGEDELTRGPVGSAEGVAGLSQVGVGCGVACTSVSQGGEQERLDGAPHSRGPCPTQQATLKTATKRTLRSREAPPILLSVTGCY